MKKMVSLILFCLVFVFAACASNGSASSEQTNLSTDVSESPDIVITREETLELDLEDNEYKLSYLACLAKAKPLIEKKYSSESEAIKYYYATVVLVNRELSCYRFSVGIEKEKGFSSFGTFYADAETGALYFDDARILKPFA